MCEILAVASETPLELGAVLSWAAELERFGISGFGWGVAWVDAEGGLHCYRKPTSLATDVQGTLELRQAGCVAALVHLRRPSRLSTVEMADTQPFVDEARRFAFVHNGRFAWDDRYRPRFHSELLGRADSEVGFRLFASLLDEGQRPVPALAAVHGALGGTANLCCLTGEGETVLYGGHPSNALYRFQLGDLHVACTGLHSDDTSVFDLVFPEGTERALVGPEPGLLRRPRSTHGAPSR
jgi:Glutamine amidotransferases class-II